MKKLLITFLLAIMSLFTLTSCVTTAVAQDEVYVSTRVSDIELAITYGTPYIIEDAVIYYLYNGLYYYPFYTDGYYYYHVYSRPLSVYPRHWRPVPRNHWFRRGRFHNEFRHHRPHHIDRRPSPGNHQMHSRPNTPNRQPSRVAPNRTFTPRSTVPNSRGTTTPRGGGHFGGRR